LSGIINIVSPMPPRPNGIADYCYAIAEELMRLAPLRIVSDDPFALGPGGLKVHDPEQIHRYAGPDDLFNYQIGNNPDHGFVLKLLRRQTGVVTLHDLNLLYLYETTGAPKETLVDLMMSSSPRIGAVWSMHQELGLGGDRTRHCLCDLQKEVIDLSQAVIVHSQFARKMIALNHGEAAAVKVKVIPHFAPDPTRYDRGKCRAALGMSEGEVIVLTSGFATKAKRFDWIVAALDDVIRSGRTFRWIHAGQERPSEFALAEAIKSRKDLWACSVVTGYLSESELDKHIGAADIVINLRFPSVGESSGTLARSYAAGSCCIVSDTAGYAEIPADRAVRIPVFNVEAHLARELAKLIDQPDLRRAYGARARRWAANELSRATVAKAYKDVFDQCRAEPGFPSTRPGARRPGEALVRLGDDANANLLDIEGALSSFLRRGALVIQFKENWQLQETFARGALDELLARRGFTATDVDVKPSSIADGDKRIVISIEAGL
jgi:glycosyltransferase involved in cell wall biosynthesis